MSDVTSYLTKNFMPFGHGCHEVIDPGPGLYAMWLRDQCLYVGMSEDLRRRILQHEAYEDNQDLVNCYRQFPSEVRIAAVHVDVEVGHLRQLESEAIDKLRPIVNKRRGGGAEQ